MARGAKSASGAPSSKTAAEFFTEHQHIAGFDNAGKALFTSVRELVENSLDAAESIRQLPSVEVKIREMTEREFNELHDISIRSSTEDVAEEKSNKRDTFYYTLSCKDNGCGIPANHVGDLLGRVLTGSKHGVQQTRGKFGLGAKMALIWSKKSTGLPITVRSAHSRTSTAPPTVTTTVLDIDIYRNEPRIISQEEEENTEGWRGAEISVTIQGSMSKMRSKLLQYFQQLAIITPYADLRLQFECLRDNKRDIVVEFLRRSEQMPQQSTIMEPHAESLNNIVLTQLLRKSECQTLTDFLVTDISGVKRATAENIAERMGWAPDAGLDLPNNKVSQLLQIFKDVGELTPPDAKCLSPAGQYNLRLGVMKELSPKFVATFTDNPSSYEGHPFIVEAAVSLGGSEVPDGINIFRFANRIPLLFEAGGDVVTRTATTNINWASYKIDPKKDKIGVFVSIVSTKIPFKGTSKEYIGDDIAEFKASVKRAIQGCCQQLRIHLASTNAAKELQERRKLLMQFIPNVAHAVFTIATSIAASYGAENVAATTTSGGRKKRATASASAAGPSNKDDSTLSEQQRAKRMKVAELISKGQLTQQTIRHELEQAVQKADLTLALDVGSLENKNTQSFCLPVDDALPIHAPTDNRRWDETAAASIGCIAHRLLNGVGTIYIKAPMSEQPAPDFTNNTIDMTEVN